MTNEEKERDLLKLLEESLWIPKTRSDKDYMGHILDNEFFEFGRSGKTYTRDQCINTVQQEINAKLPLGNFIVHVVDENIRLVTYISEIHNKTIERANSSSLWIRRNSQWKLYFHQGTPI